MDTDARIFANEIKLAKACVDIGMFTNRLKPALDFWQEEAGAAFDHVLSVRPGHDQHRHDVLGSVLKINYLAEPLSDSPPSGYRELLIAREGLPQPKHLADPDGNLVTLVPHGYRGIEQTAIRIDVRDLAAQRRFYGNALGLVEVTATSTRSVFRAGETLIFLEESSDAPSDASIHGMGWRYITFQVFKVGEEHRRVLQHGGREAMAPETLGTTAKFSMVRDPDGNWIELSQRASIVGSLD